MSDDQDMRLEEEEEGEQEGEEEEQPLYINQPWGPGVAVEKHLNETEENKSYDLYAEDIPLSERPISRAPIWTIPTPEIIMREMKHSVPSIPPVPPVPILSPVSSLIQLRRRVDILQQELEECRATLRAR